MKLRTVKLLTMSTMLALAGMASTANAGIIDSQSTLLDDAGATLLEGWLGQGDLDWDSVWYGETGATASSWHSIADTLTHTVSIYQAINALGDNVLVGGYTSLNWSVSGDYKSDPTAFIFNLTQPEYQASIHTNTSIVTVNSYFATFGGGHDLFGGHNTIGNPDSNWSDGYTSANAYDTSKGTIDVGNGDNTLYNGSNTLFSVSALETFTFAAAATAVPEPSSLAILGLGLMGMGAMRRKKHR